MRIADLSPCSDFEEINGDCRLRNKKFRIYSMYNQKGLTLLEIAISIAILAIALVALANLFPIGLRASRRASDFSEASILAQRVIENIKRSASIHDAGDLGNFLDTPYDVSDGDKIGYFELTNYGIAGVGNEFFPFSDDDLSGTTLMTTGSSIYGYKYDYADTVFITVEDWDANGNGKIGRDDPFIKDWDDVKLSQKVYVAIYWTEADRDRAETFITYISNPFYEKYR